MVTPSEKSTPEVVDSRTSGSGASVSGSGSGSGGKYSTSSEARSHFSLMLDEMYWYPHAQSSLKSQLILIGSDGSV